MRIFGFIAVAVAAVELLLCFSGPMAFFRKPDLLVFPPFASQLTDEEVIELTEFVEQQIALTKSYSIITYSSLEEYHIRTDPGFEKSSLRPANYVQARSFAEEHEIERFAIGAVYAWDEAVHLSVSVWDTADGSSLRGGSYTSDSLGDMLEGIGKNGERLDFREELSVSVKGVSFTDYLILALFCFELAVGVLAILGRRPGVLVEIVCASGLILFLFAYIYALSANLDYVQRYIASRGQLRLAQSTSIEQLHAVLRYGPLLLLNSLYYVWQRLRSRRGRHLQHGNSWVHRYITRWSLAWVVIAAGLFSFSFPSAISLEGIGWLAWFALVPLLLVLMTVKPAMGIFYGVAFGTLQALILNYWHGTYDYVTLHMITIGFVVEYALLMIPLVLLIRASGKWGFLVVPLAWAFFDYLRSSGVLGYPWGLIGTTQYRFLPLIQIASVTGVWGINFIVLLCNASLAWALAASALGWKWPTIRSGSLGVPVPSDVSSSGWQRVWKRIAASARRSGMPRSLLPLAVFGGLFATCLVAGTVILAGVRSRLYGSEDVPTATVVLLQQNTDPRKREYQENNERLMAITDDALASLSHPPDLVAWPEGGFKLDIRHWSAPERKNTYWGRVVQTFIEYQRNLGTWLVTGTQDHETVVTEDGETIRRDFNSSVLLSSDGQLAGFYHKMHLVPFSEYFPFDKEKFAALYSFFETYDISDWDLGSSRVVYQHERMRFFTPVCFEDVFSDHVRRFVLQDVDLILNMSNDYWSLSPVEGRQHGIFSLFRAVENQRPVLRTTSSGYTVYIDATGQIQPGSPEPYTEGYVIARVPLPERRLTLYTRWGDWFPWMCCAVLLVFVIAKIVWVFAGSRQTIGGPLTVGSSPTIMR